MTSHGAARSCSPAGTRHPRPHQPSRPASRSPVSPASTANLRGLPRGSRRHTTRAWSAQGMGRSAARTSHRRLPLLPKHCALPVDRGVNDERAAAIAGMLFCQDQLGGVWELVLAMTLPQPLSTVLKRSLRPGPLPIAAGGPGTFAQFTPRRSLVRSQYRPPGMSPGQKLLDRPHPPSRDGAFRLRAAWLPATTPVRCGSRAPQRPRRCPCSRHLSWLRKIRGQAVREKGRRAP